MQQSSKGDEKMAKSKKWIQPSIKRKGRITRECKKRGYSGVTNQCLDEIKRSASKRHDRSLMGAAVLAKRFRGGDLAKAKKRKKRKSRKKKK